ncbi:MAG: lamin tail domain-containing protein, partial [Opitutae bacterium]|nr:lamin tail domain-containing protein [Opitutae bacterium]
MKKWLVGLVCVGVMATAAMGQILAFDFSALAGNEATADSSSKDANLATSTISRGAGLTASANGGRFNATGWALTSIANAVSGNNYVEFTITPQSGYQFDVSSIYVQWQRSATGNSVVSLRSSLDGYASDLDSNWTIDDTTATQNKTWTFTQGNSTAPVTYRLYSYAEALTGSGGPGDGTGNDIVVNGTVSVGGFGVGFDKANGFTVEEGSSDAITATAANGTAPYGYVWSSTLGGAYYTAVDNVFTILATAPIGDYAASVTATDATLATTSNGLNFSVTAPAAYYAIAITPPVNGTVTTTPETEASAGATVTVNATPAGGYAVGSIAVVDAAMNPVAVTGNTFVMPASAVTVTVTFGVAPDFALDFSDVPTIAYADVSTTANGVALDIAQCYRDVNAPDYMIRMRWISTNAGYFGNATAFTNGSISKMTFQYKAYGASHTNYQFIVQFKTTGGEWTQVGDTYLASNTDWATAEVLSVPAGATYFRIQSVAPESGTVIKTGNFDNFGFWFGEPTFGVTFDQANGFAIEEGTTDVITATAANGVAPYSYSWTSSLGESYRTIANDQLTVLATAPVGDYTAQVVATDSDAPAKSVTNSLNFSVAAPATMYAITITPPINGTVTTTPETEAAAGTTVTVNATPAGGYAVQSIEVNGGAVTVTGTTFTMPAEPVTVTVTFQESSATGELIISQYYEGPGNNKWIEIYNPGSSAIDLGAGGYRLGRWDNANREAWKVGTAPNGTIILSNGTIAAGGTYLVANSSATNPAYAVANQLSGNITFTGDDSVVLYTGATYAYANVVDAFGMVTNAAQDKSFVRKPAVTAGVNTDFNAADWDEFTNVAVNEAAESTNERLGYHSTGPTVFGVSLNRASGFTIEQGTSDAITATAANGVAPYSYAWTSSLGESYRTAADNVFTVLATAPVGDYFATVVATDDAAQTASNSVTFSVTAPAVKYA